MGDLLREAAASRRNLVFSRDPEGRRYDWIKREGGNGGHGFAPEPMIGQGTVWIPVHELFLHLICLPPCRKIIIALALDIIVAPWRLVHGRNRPNAAVETHPSMAKRKCFRKSTSKSYARGIANWSRRISPDC
jgi:hypothetical protein